MAKVKKTMLYPSGNEQKVTRFKGYNFFIHLELTSHFI